LLARISPDGNHARLAASSTKGISEMKLRSKNLIQAIGFTIAMSGSAAAADAAEAVIDQQGLKFAPTTVTINAGDSIRFENHDPFTHDITITSPDGSSSDKGLQHHGESKVVAFPKSGTFSISCELHPMMKATVIVK
jgi:plastocyanin